MNSKCIQVDPEKCIGCGSCSILASKTFGLNDDYIAKVLPEAGDDEETILFAKDGCPTKAISIDENC